MRRTLTIIVTLALLASMSGCVHMCAISGGDVNQNITQTASWEAVWAMFGLAMVLLFLFVIACGSKGIGGGRPEGS
jgi:ribose/xylose/arabinose/galactoside ABC-type transport system permease subunit